MSFLFRTQPRSYQIASNTALGVTLAPAGIFASFSITTTGGSTYPLVTGGTGVTGDAIDSTMTVTSGTSTYAVYSFTNTTTTYTLNYNCTNAAKPINIFMVGGGGGGGSLGGGGGGGGVIMQSFSVPSGLGSMTINVGAGGPGAGGTPQAAGSNGSNTTVILNAISKTITAGGGCGGVGPGASPYTLYGSGGGGGFYTTPATNANYSNQPGIVLYGNSGGAGIGSGVRVCGGGGGGGTNGYSYNNPAGTCGGGGAGIQCFLNGIKEFNPTGTPYGNYYWAGGGAGSSDTTVTGPGGVGGGGGSGNNNGVAQSSGGTGGISPGENGTVVSTQGKGGAGGNYTGGGGGGCWISNSAGKGGSGIVIVAFPLVQPVTLIESLNTDSTIQMYFTFDTSTISNSTILNLATTAYSGNTNTGSVSTSTYKITNSVNSSYSASGVVNSTSFISLGSWTPGPNGYTIAVWMQTGAWTNFQQIFQFSNSYANVISIQVSSATSLFITDGGGSSTSLTVPTLSTNTWYHFTMTATSTNLIKIYINGYPSGSWQSGSTYSTTVNGVARATCWLGKTAQNNTIYGAGYYDDLRVYNRELNLSEINALATTITI